MGGITVSVVPDDGTKKKVTVLHLVVGFRIFAKKLSCYRETEKNKGRDVTNQRHAHVCRSSCLWFNLLNRLLPFLSHHFKNVLLSA